MFNLFSADAFKDALLDMDSSRLASLIVKVEGDEDGAVHFGSPEEDAAADYHSIADADEASLREHIIRKRELYEPHVVRASVPVNIVDAAQDDVVCDKMVETQEEEKEQLEAAKYQGREVQLNKPMKGDVKKFKVYVKDPKTGNIKKVNFGDPNMEIKRDDPKRRKNFRSRHHCENPGPKTKARYWSCRMWSRKPVSKIVSAKDGE